MGAWVLASVFHVCFLLSGAQNPLSTIRYEIQHVPLRLSSHTQDIDDTKHLLVEKNVHSATPIKSYQEAEVSATNYQRYNVPIYKFSAEDARSVNPYPYHNEDVGSYESGVNYKDFSSIEAEAGEYKNNLDTTGYQHYKTASSFTLEGPKQLESITTQSFHKEVEPYDVSGFQSKHKEEGNAEVHYHQHKHLHKHNHKQEHVHKHQQDHKHDHGHKHAHKAHHQHKQESKHTHSHHAEHKHSHSGQHSHQHHQEHQHSHHADHKHHHKHHQKHEHHAKHAHKHSHQGEHKHTHHAEHKHDHHHGHKHDNKHKHKHEHYSHHKHRHGHRSEHKHSHHGGHYHKYHKY